MGDVIYIDEWRRERLGVIRRDTFLRRSRRGQGKGSKTLTAGSDLSAELRRLLLE